MAEVILATLGSSSFLIRFTPRTGRWMRKIKACRVHVVARGEHLFWRSSFQRARMHRKGVEDDQYRKASIMKSRIASGSVDRFCEKSVLFTFLKKIDMFQIAKAHYIFKKGNFRVFLGLFARYSLSQTLHKDQRSYVQSRGRDCGNAGVSLHQRKPHRCARSMGATGGVRRKKKRLFEEKFRTFRILISGGKF
jgi:hypothetical protein